MEWLFDDEEELIKVIDATVANAVAGTEWEERAASFTPDTPFPERLTLYKELREAAAIPEPETFFLIAWAVEEIADEQIQELFKAQYESRFVELEAKYGINPEEFLEFGIEDIPEEYDALNMEFAQAAHAITVSTFAAYKEQKLAALYKNQPDEYSRRYIAGSEYLLGAYEGQFGTDREVD